MAFSVSPASLIWIVTRSLKGNRSISRWRRSTSSVHSEGLRGSGSDRDSVVLLPCSNSARLLSMDTVRGFCRVSDFQTTAPAFRHSFWSQ